MIFIGDSIEINGDEKYNDMSLKRHIYKTGGEQGAKSVR